MSKVQEIHKRLKRIEEAEFFPSACVDIAETLIRKTADVEFQIVGNIELAYRRGYQAGSYGLETLTRATRDKILAILEAVAPQSDVMVIDEDMAIMGGGVTRDIRRMAGELLGAFECMPGSKASEEDSP